MDDLMKKYNENKDKWFNQMGDAIDRGKKEIRLSEAAVLRLMSLELNKAADHSSKQNEPIVTLTVSGAREWAEMLEVIANSLDK